MYIPVIALVAEAGDTLQALQPSLPAATTTYSRLIERQNLDI